MQGEQESIIKQFFQKKVVWVFLFLDLLAIVFVVFASFTNIQKNSIMTFNVAPLGAKIYVNGIEYQNGKTYRFASGKYKVAIFHDELTSKELEIELNDDSAITITTFLTDGSGEFYESKSNYSSFEKLSQIASSANNVTIDHDTSLEQFIDSFQKKYAIYNEPFIGKAISLKNVYGDWYIWGPSASEKCSETLCLYVVGLSKEDEPLVSSLIQEYGYNINDYQIVYDANAYQRIKGLIEGDNSYAEE